MAAQAHRAVPALRLYDTRRAGVFEVVPLGDGPIGLYVCGITPYDTTHVGHAFTYVAFDVLRRYLEYGGHHVRYVQNVTDVDDDMLRHARERGEDYLDLGRRQADRFLADMATLNWRPPDVYPRATEHVPQVVAMIERLLSAGAAYLAAGGYVYLSVAADPEFGVLSHVAAADRLAMANEHGNLPDLPGKRDSIDPVLWQPSARDEPSWPAPWGAGRPGWHIECSAMSVTHLGPQFEIHGGGLDLAFPHHEVERIQSERATGRAPVVGHWVHTGMVRYDAAKMSKSLGNLVMVRDLLADWTADAIRLALVSRHYRAELEWTERLLVEADARARRWAAAAATAGQTDAAAGPGGAQGPVADLRAAAVAALADDLDTPRTVDALDRLAEVAGGPDATVARDAAGVLRDLATGVLGVRLESTS